MPFSCCLASISLQIKAPQAPNAVSQSGRWIFETGNIRGNQVTDATDNGFDARINGSISFNSSPRALVLSGSGGGVAAEEILARYDKRKSDFTPPELETPSDFVPPELATPKAGP